MTDSEWIVRARAFMGDRGLNLFAIIAADTLSAANHAAFAAQKIELSRQQRLIVIGAGGRDCWNRIAAEGPAPQAGHGNHPIDNYAAHAAEAFCKQFLNGARTTIAYPSSVPVPLIALGEQLGWSAPSALGMGINSEFGMWFAYRALIITDGHVPESGVGFFNSPAGLCDDCHHHFAAQGATSPCISACPSGAVRGVSQFDLETCADYRLGAASPCETDCAARRACPVGTQHAYGDDQMHYHMVLSLPGLRRWREASARD